MITLRVPFDATDDISEYAKSNIGKFHPDLGDRSLALSSYPAVIVDDTPFVICQDRSRLGDDGDVLAQLRHHANNGRIRRDPLLPGTNPRSALVQFSQCRRWPFGIRSHDDVNLFAFMAIQTFRLLRDEENVRVWKKKQNLIDEPVREQWAKICRLRSNDRLRWSVELNRYIQVV